MQIPCGTKGCNPLRHDRLENEAQALRYPVSYSMNSRFGRFRAPATT